MRYSIRAFLQEQGGGKLGEEEASLYRELTARGYPITLFLAKKMHRRQLPLTRQSFVAGEMDIVVAALKQLEISIPQPNDYPPSLAKFLHRRTWTSSLGVIEAKLQQEVEINPIFAKPANRRKRFTGRVFESLADLGAVSGVSRKEELICSEAVNWKSEYRVYIIHCRIVGTYYYSGDRNIKINRSVVEDAVRCLDNAGEAIAGYSLDFGVLETGETALVEMNDGFALGNYGLDDKQYADLILARWKEILANT
ncbi:MAG: ATP-grasp domain-containing protein [Cyanobacteriota bacterium]|nr:ATP-grasp domain-containing protein [Cyanobacteriota bacterium]